MALKIKKLYEIDASKLSDEGFMLNATYLAQIQRDRHVQEYEALSRIDAKNVAKSRFYLVHIGNAPYWASVITGTLYNSFGQCMTSRVLRIIEQPIPLARTERQKTRIAA